ncbi:MAG TPA: hypothetical protein VK915_13150 [Gaiellaceae bacterium]|nr:hypothetical protein [Gaiellaceae bacterium]
MAEEQCHAAEHERYEVREALAGEPRVDLGLRFQTEDVGDAVDFAFDYLARQDPQREGIVGALEIVRVAGDDRETVWSYSHSRATASARDLTRIWGFDVTRPWSGPYRTSSRPSPASR